MAWPFRGTSGAMLSGGSGLSAVILLGAARLARRRAQVVDTWTFDVQIAVILLGL